MKSGWSLGSLGERPRFVLGHGRKVEVIGIESLDATKSCGIPLYHNDCVVSRHKSLTIACLMELFVGALPLIGCQDVKSWHRPAPRRRLASLRIHTIPAHRWLQHLFHIYGLHAPLRYLVTWRMEYRRRSSRKRGKVQSVRYLLQPTPSFRLMFAKAAA